MSQPAESERRLKPRMRTFLAGRLAYGDPQVNVACTVRNLTDLGASVQLETPTVFAAGHLQLLLIARGEAYDAAIVWNRGLWLGLHFTGRYDLRENADGARYLQALWRQTAPR